MRREETIALNVKEIEKSIRDRDIHKCAGRRCALTAGERDDV